MSIRRRLGSAFLVWMTCLLAARISPMFAATYWVAQMHPNATDANGGTDDKPFKTIGAALTHLMPGDTVIVSAGIYREEIVIDRSRGGTALAPVTIRADTAAPRGSVVLDGTRVIAPEHWTPFVSARFGVRREDNVWTSRHSPDDDCTGEELRITAWPYKVYPGGYSPDGSTIRYGTVHLFGDDRELTLVPPVPVKRRRDRLGSTKLGVRTVSGDATCRTGVAGGRGFGCLCPTARRELLLCM